MPFRSAHLSANLHRYQDADDQLAELRGPG
jgi:hypothetical protein